MQGVGSRQALKEGTSEHITCYHDAEGDRVGGVRTVIHLRRRGTECERHVCKGSTQ